MSNTTGLNLDIILEENVLVNFSITDGNGSLYHIINGQVLSQHPSLLIKDSLSNEDVLILETMKNKELATFQGGDYVNVLSSLQIEMRDAYYNIDGYLRAMKRGKLLPDLISHTVLKEALTGNDERVKNYLNHLKSRIEAAAIPLQRLIDICTYAEAMNQQVKLYWHDN